MTVTSASVTPSIETTSMLGRVKWFNNKAGYGFITVTDGGKSGSDIFVHHTAIVVSSQQYKYLVQGEYVEFVLSDNAMGIHQFTATNVTGVKGGSLMCETRHDSNNARKTNDSNMPRNIPRPPRISIPVAQSPKSNYKKDATTPTPRARGGGQKDWFLVKSDNKEKMM
jgi:cold shock CspA family protein